MSCFVALNEPYSVETDFVTKENACVCCLVKNVPFVNLMGCKHAKFLEAYNYELLAIYPNVLACVHCHNMLEKIDVFRQQVEESALILTRQTLNWKVHRLHDLKSTNAEVTVNIEPESTEMNEYPFKDAIFKEDNSAADIKVESDLSDDEIEVPLSEIKKKNEQTRKYYPVKLKSIKMEKSEPSPFIDEKYIGKLKMLLLSKEELEQERNQLRRDAGYLKLPYKCETCLIGFNREAFLKKHLKQRHNQEVGAFVCDVCKCVFGSEVSLKPHHRRHFIRYECKLCSKRYIDERAVVSHCNEKHGKDGATVHNKFRCILDDCSFETHSYRKYMYHRSQHDSYPCKLCNKVYVKWIQLRSHI